jgi:histidinol-phosphate aminotransferase
MITKEMFGVDLADLPVEEIRKILGKEKVFKLSFNENPLGPSPKAIEAMRKALYHLNLYPSSAGDSLKLKLAEKEGIRPENIILSNGADEMISLVVQAFLRPGDEAIIPEITFVQYLASTRLMGATPILSPMKGDLGIDLEGILSRITPKTKLIFLCNPNNPTGKVIPPNELAEFLEKIPEHVLVVVDEAYHEYANEEEYASSVQFVKQEQPVIVIRTFSKIYSLAAARIGYGIGPVTIIDSIEQIRPPFNVNGIAQVGALASLEDQNHLLESKRLNESGKAQIYIAFEELDMKYIPSHTNFVFVDMEADCEMIFKQLAEKGIIVRSLANYGLTTAIRVSIGCEEGVCSFIQAMMRLKS